MKLLKSKWSIACLLLSAGWFISVNVYALDAKKVEVRGLFKNAAILQVNGQQRMLKVGQTSPEGIKLIAADSKQAEIEIDGKRTVLSLSKKIAATFSEAALGEARIPAGRNGHYFTTGMINNQSVKLLVDTGASSIALNSIVAKQLGIDYLTSPRYVGVATASGTTRGYRVTLREVTVGGITLNNVIAVVTEGEFPRDILLGNTFLSELDMKVESGVLILQAKY